MKNNPEHPLQVVPLVSTRPFLDLFLTAYIEVALWATTGDDGQPLDRKYTVADFAPEAITRMESDALLFYTLGDVANMTNDEQKRAGHDFFLTRNGHGAGFWDGDWAGFWDGDWEEPLATQLTMLAHTFMPSDIYVGDDRKLYVTTHGQKKEVLENEELTQ